MLEWSSTAPRAATAESLIWEANTRPPAGGHVVAQRGDSGGLPRLHREIGINRKTTLARRQRGELLGSRFSPDAVLSRMRAVLPVQSTWDGIRAPHRAIVEYPT